MTPSEFKTGMDRIRNVFGDKAYPEERVDLIWQETRRLTAGEFATIVGELIAAQAAPPLIGKFREAMAYMNSKNSGIRKQEREDWRNRQKPCRLCGKTGWVQAERVVDGSLYAFRCHCPCGEELLSRSIPQWLGRFDVAHGGDYQPLYIGDEGPLRPTTKIVPPVKDLAAIVDSEYPE